MTEITYAIKVCYGDDVFSFPFIDKSSPALFDDFTEEIGNKIGISQPSIFTYEDDVGDHITVRDSNDLCWALDQARTLQDSRSAFPRLKISLKNSPVQNARRGSRRIVRHEKKPKHAEDEIKNEEHDANGDHEQANESDESSDWSPDTEKEQVLSKRASYPSTSSTFFETAVKVLRKTRIPMTAGQVTKYAIDCGLLKTTGKTPKVRFCSMISDK
jgi:hypothetical protein